MELEWDPEKDESNRAAHGIGLSDFAGFDEEPLVVEDDRQDFGETRWRAFGRIEGKAHVLVFTVRESGLRLISFRRAHEKEMRRHGR